MKKGTFLQIDNMRDPDFWRRRFTSEDLTTVTRLIKDNRRDRFNVVTFFFGIFIAGLLSFFAIRENWVLSILFLDIILILVILQVKKHNRRDEELIPLWKKLIKFGKSIGIKFEKSTQNP